jgi:CsoR family transcriptional regulator, copper-sensing transcriptional repressor
MIRVSIALDISMSRQRRNHVATRQSARPGHSVPVGLTRLQRTIENHTGRGYMSRMRNDIKTSCAKRLSRIEGQVRGIARMLDEDRYCIDVVTQISAVRAALRRLEEEILRDHVAHCVEHAIASGNKAEQRRKIEELMEVVSRAER